MEKTAEEILDEFESNLETLAQHFNKKVSLKEESKKKG